MEASALKHAGPTGLRGPTPLLRLQSDERLIALVRRGNHAAFEALVARYQSRLLAFCRHMLGSREDAEDVLQEVFAASFNAILADERTINVRPWLYRIARNRSLNHLRRTQAVGVDSMDVHLSEGGLTTADKVHSREEFRQLIGDVQQLPETQRTALLLREIDALSYDQIAEAMETTVPSVKSLLVRARVSLAEMAEARQLTCEEVREELGEVAEGLKRTTAPVRRHVRGCDRCGAFRAQLKSTNRALASVLPVGPLLFLKKAVLAHLGTTASAGGAAATGGAAAGGGAGLMSAGVGAVASKTAAGLAAAAIVTAGAVEVKRAQVAEPHPSAARAIAAPQPAPAAAAQAAPEPVAVAQVPQPATRSADPAPAAKASEREAKAAAAAETAPKTTTTEAAVPPPPATTPTPAPAPEAPPAQGGDTTALGGDPGTAEPQGPPAQPQEPAAADQPQDPAAAEPLPDAAAQGEPTPGSEARPEGEPGSAPRGEGDEQPPPPQP